VAHFKITLEHMNEGGGKLKEPAVEKAGWISELWTQDLPNE
jgi:hypothetical protein